MKRASVYVAVTLAASVTQASMTRSANAQPQSDDITNNGKANADAQPVGPETTGRQPRPDEAEKVGSEAPVTDTGAAEPPAEHAADNGDAVAETGDAAIASEGEEPPIAEDVQTGEATATAGATASKPQFGFETGPALVLTAGTLSGIGIGYRQFYGRLGLQVAGIGVIFDDGGFASAGLQLYYTISRNGVARFYGLVGGSVFHDYDRDSNFGTTAERTTIFAGAGLGISIEIPSGFLLALELPMHAVIRAHNSRFLVTPGVSASIGYTF